MTKLLDENSLRAVKTYVDNLVESLPEPMTFQGSVGTNGTKTWSNYAIGAKVGWTYKVITDHSITPICKAGDTIIYNGTEWVVIPSGDEPKGTVTSVNAAGAANSHIQVSNGPITDSGSLTIGIEYGYSIPSNEKQIYWDDKVSSIVGSSTQQDVVDIPYLHDVIYTAPTIVSSTAITDISGGSGNLTAAVNSSGSGDTTRRTLVISHSHTAAAVSGTTPVVSTYSGGSILKETKYLHTGKTTSQDTQNAINQAESNAINQNY